MPLPPQEAFGLFTPLGERHYEHGWDPWFPVEVTDDTEPGTVFVTEAHGQHTTWLVTDRQPAKRISYARVTPGDRAGTVTVSIEPGAKDVGAGHSTVEITYDLTALTAAADFELLRFADGYAAFLRSWQDSITAFLSGRPSDGVARTAE